jgi:hypothetical protein
MDWYCYRVERISDNEQVVAEPRAWTEVELHACIDNGISDPAYGKCVMQLDYNDDRFEAGGFYRFEFDSVIFSTQ